MTTREGGIAYRGNQLFPPLERMDFSVSPMREVEERVAHLAAQDHWAAIARINHQIVTTTNRYFSELGALFTLLPLTTRMISSPGAVYGKAAIDYTTDTCPLTLRWFDLESIAFLSESSQIYLELALRQRGIDQVYCIYNSFRKEHADPTHLSEFHHIEYEGKVTQQQNETIALGLTRDIIDALLAHEERSLAHFLCQKRLQELADLSADLAKTSRLTFREALDLLRQDTGDSRYQPFTMKDTFGVWEEVRLTEICGGPVIVTEFPLLEVPFYHATLEGREPLVADNADFIWPGYREFIGSGRRVESVQQLSDKARIFNLPKDDYQPYHDTRSLPGYVPTAGFGLGWERLLHGLLEMPFIWSASQFPRVHETLRP